MGGSHGVTSNREAAYTGGYMSTAAGYMFQADQQMAAYHQASLAAAAAAASTGGGPYGCYGSSGASYGSHHLHGGSYAQSMAGYCSGLSMTGPSLGSAGAVSGVKQEHSPRSNSSGGSNGPVDRGGGGIGGGGGVSGGRGVGVNGDLRDMISMYLPWGGGGTSVDTATGDSSYQFQSAARILNGQYSQPPRGAPMGGALPLPQSGIPGLSEIHCGLSNTAPLSHY